MNLHFLSYYRLINLDVPPTAFSEIHKFSWPQLLGNEWQYKRISEARKRKHAFIWNSSGTSERFSKGSIAILSLQTPRCQMPTKKHTKNRCAKMWASKKLSVDTRLKVCFYRLSSLTRFLAYKIPNPTSSAASTPKRIFWCKTLLLLCKQTRILNGENGIITLFLGNRAVLQYLAQIAEWSLVMTHFKMYKQIFKSQISV